MAGNSSRDGNSRSGKRAADQSFINNPKERKRGFGIAKLERMRAEEEEMKEKNLKPPFSGAYISGAGVQGLMAYGTGGYPSGQSDLPFARPPSTSGAATHVNPSNTPTTLQLFPDHMENGYADSNKEDDHNPSAEPTCKNSDDPQDQLDLDLKL
ncbi:unnamed protein product [Urochloa humidicola]